MHLSFPTPVKLSKWKSMENEYIAVKDDQVVKLGKFRKIVEPEQRSQEEGEQRFSDELMNLLDMLKLKYKLSKWLCATGS